MSVDFRVRGGKTDLSKLHSSLDYEDDKLKSVVNYEVSIYKLKV